MKSVGIVNGFSWPSVFVPNQICRVTIMRSSGFLAVVLLKHFRFSALDDHDASDLNRRRTSPMNSQFGDPIDKRLDLLTPVAFALYAGRDGKVWMEIAVGRQKRH